MLAKEEPIEIKGTVLENLPLPTPEGSLGLPVCDGRNPFGRYQNALRCCCKRMGRVSQAPELRNGRLPSGFGFVVADHGACKCAEANGPAPVLVALAELAASHRTGHCAQQ